MVWLGLRNLAAYRLVGYSELRVLGLAFLAIGLAIFIDAFIYALPDSRQRAKSRLRIASLLSTVVGLALLIASLVVRFTAP
jgi:hypothetical protein